MVNVVKEGAANAKVAADAINENVKDKACKLI